MVPAPSRFTNLPKGLTDEFTGFQKEAYYYSAQLKEYKDILNDPDKMVQKGPLLLNKLPAFTSYMKQNSELASLFRLPSKANSSKRPNCNCCSIS